MTRNTSVAANEWLEELPRYPFVALREKKKALREKGVEVIDFSIGDPVAPTPDLVLNAAKEGMKQYQSSGYPENKVSDEYRKAVASWLLRRFNVSVDAEREIFPSLGAKEAVFAFPNVIQGGSVIVPTSGLSPLTTAEQKRQENVFIWCPSRLKRDFSLISSPFQRKLQKTQRSSGSTTPTTPPR